MKGCKLWRIAALLVTAMGAVLVAPQHAPELVGQLLAAV